MNKLLTIIILAAATWTVIAAPPTWRVPLLILYAILVLIYIIAAKIDDIKERQDERDIPRLPSGPPGPPGRKYNPGGAYKVIRVGEDTSPRQRVL